jgi:hypothetical protein
MSRPDSAAVHFSLEALCVVMLAASPGRAQQLPIAGVVKNLNGSAVLVRSGQELPITPGQPIAEGDTIRTGGDGRLGITLKDGTRVSLGGDTELRLDQFAYVPAEGRLAIAVKLLRGVAEYISGRIARLAPGAIKIETPTSVIGIRGTRLLIEVEQP